VVAERQAPLVQPPLQRQAADAGARADQEVVLVDLDVVEASEVEDDLVARRRQRAADAAAAAGRHQPAARAEHRGGLLRRAGPDDLDLRRRIAGARPHQPLRPQVVHPLPLAAHAAAQRPASQPVTIGTPNP